MGKGPILLLGAAAVAGIALAMSRKSTEDTTTATPAPTVPKGTSAQDLTKKQMSKLETWAKSKGVPIDKAYALAQDLFTTKF